MKLGRKVNAMIERIIKAVYILTIALVVFLGGLLISKGMHISSEQTADAAISEARQTVIDSQDGNAL